MTKLISNQKTAYKSKFKLKKFHVILCLLHIFQAFLILFLANDFSVPITTTYLSLSESETSINIATRTIADIPLVTFVWFYLFFTSLIHFLHTIPSFYQAYEKKLEKRVNLSRWLEYSLSSSVMMVIISLLVGVFDLSSLILIFSLNVAMTISGYIMERINYNKKSSEKVEWLPFIAGCLYGIIPWLVIFLYFFGALDGKYIHPSFVYSILPSLLFLISFFPINMFLHYKKVGVFKDYLVSEKTYITLSLITKSVLAWQIFFGFLMY